MEEGNNRFDLQRNYVRQSSARSTGGLKSTLSGKSTPRGSPSFRRLSSSRTPRREGRTNVFNTHCLRGNRTVLWLLLITLWAYAGFYVQSRWAHGDNKEGIFLSGSNLVNKSFESEEVPRRDLSASNSSLTLGIRDELNKFGLKKMDVVLAQKANANGPPQRVNSKTSKKSVRKSGRTRGKQKMAAETKASAVFEVPEEEIPSQNASYRMLVGPFGSIEDRVLEWRPEKRSGTCDRKGQFARLVWSRKFVLIFHELSMTGAPLSMMELATELLSCGATVSVVVLSKKGGLMAELVRRKIKVLEDKDKLSFKTAMKADLVIAGSAVCSSWIENYLDFSVAGSRQLVWWIMENRREYFDRSKLFLNRVKMLVFLSESQLKQWQAWCEEEKIQLKSPPSLVPLSVNDELAFVAGILCSLNTPAFSTEKMTEKRNRLRKAVREEMGLTENDMLVMSLSSINPGKGLFLLLESASFILDQTTPPYDDVRLDSLSSKDEDDHYRALLQRPNRKRSKSKKLLPHAFNSSHKSTALKFDNFNNSRKLQSGGEKKQAQALKILIGSVGSKSNKVPYVKAVLSFLSKRSNVSKSVLWTPATTRVASLYAAADVYIINSQGLGETFGRVTIEAMAFGLPVLGTDAGATKEIVENNVTGLLHPVGRPGTRGLSRNLQFFLENPLAREAMGLKGREKVEKMYLKKHMYKIFGEVLYNTMRVK